MEINNLKYLKDLTILEDLIAELWVHHTMIITKIKGYHTMLKPLPKNTPDAESISILLADALDQEEELLDRINAYENAYDRIKESQQ